MSDKKHIDRLFQETFKNFEESPSDAVWGKIEAKLKNKKKRRVIPIWWRYAGVAALLLLLLTVGNSYFNKNTSVETPTQIVDTDENNNSNSIEDKNDVSIPNPSNNTVVNNNTTAVANTA